MIVIISPIVLIALVVILLTHAAIAGSAIVAGIAVLAAVSAATIGIVTWLAVRLRRKTERNTALKQFQSSGYIPRAMTSSEPPSRPAIEPPTEIHNHLHIEGIDPEQLAAYVRRLNGREPL